MGGVEDSSSSRRENNALIWSAILELAKEHHGEFPFSAREVVRRIGTVKSHSVITRDRNGLVGMERRERERFIDELKKEVAREIAHTGEIRSVFCHRVGALIVAYHELFALDIINEGYRNSKVMLYEIRPFILEKRMLIFSAEFYQLLMDWYADGFTRDSLSEKYGNLIHQLFKKYQKTRPDMGIGFKSSSDEVPGMNYHDKLKEANG